MSKIAVILTDDFEDSEYAKPADAFKKAGHQLTHVGLEKGKTVKGKKEGTPVKIDVAVKDASADHFDALFVPGGYSPDKLRAHSEAVEFARKFADSGKPILMICHAAQLLISAQALQGRKVTGWKSIAQDLKNAGAQYLDQEVVEDGNFISSRQPADIPAFVKASLNKLKGL